MRLQRIFFCLFALTFLAVAWVREPATRRKRPDSSSLIATGTNAGIDCEMYWGEGQGECMSMWWKDRDTSTVSCGFDIPATQQVASSAFGPFDDKVIWFGAFDPAADSVKFVFAEPASPKVRVIQKKGLPLKHFVTELPLDFHGGLKGSRLVTAGREVIPKEEQTP